MFVTTVGSIYPVAETELGCHLYSSTGFPSSLPLDPEMLSSRSVMKPVFESARLSEGIVLEVELYVPSFLGSVAGSFLLLSMILLLSSSLLELLASLPSSEFLLVASCFLSKINFLAASFLATEPRGILPSLGESSSDDESLSDEEDEEDDEEEDVPESKSMTSAFDVVLELESRLG